MQEILDQLGQLLLVVAGRLLQVAAIVVALVIAYGITIWIVRRLADRAAATQAPGESELPDADRALRAAIRTRRLDTLVLFTSRLARAGLAIFGIVASIGILVPELLTALGGLGVALGAAVGAALGFGAQQLVRDYLNGILILGENPFSVGDVVAVAGIRGTVEEVGLRRTVVRDVDGAVHSVPNGEILVASNFTRTYARVNERFAVVPGTDLDRASGVLAAVCEELAAAEAWAPRFIEPPRVVRIDVAAAGDPGIPILVSATVRPGEQWEVAGELRRRALAALRTAGVDLAAGRTVLVSRAGPPAAAEPDVEGDAEYT